MSVPPTQRVTTQAQPLAVPVAQAPLAPAGKSAGSSGGATGTQATSAIGQAPTTTGPRSQAGIGMVGAKGGRALDALDMVAARAIIDLHADTPLHNLGLEGDGNPGFFMRVWMAFINFLAIFIPSLRNFFRHVTRETLDHEQRGLQVFSIATEGLPPFFRASHKAYTQLPANWPSHANDSPFNAFIFQAAWIYRESARHGDRIELGRGEDGRPRGMTTTSEVVGAIERNRIAVQIGIEGAFPLEVQADDLEAFRALRNNPNNQIPSDFPMPTDDEISTRAGRLAYMRRIGVMYIGLNHLNSSCFSGSDLFTAENQHMGLTEDGRALIRDFNQTGMILDLAHAGERAQIEAADLVAAGEYQLPVIVSHSVHQLPGTDYNWRMTHPRVLEAVRNTGGVVGIMFARTHLPNPTVQGIVDQIDAVVQRIGIDHIAFGSDADGFVGLPFQNLGDGYDQIITEMRRRGYSEEDIIKVRGGNYLHAMQRRDQIMSSRADRQRSQARRAAEARSWERALAPRQANPAGSPQQSNSTSN